MQKLGGEFEGIVVAQVITRDKHPNADKLSLCRVNDGTRRTADCLRRAKFQGGRQSAADSARPDAAGQTRRAAASRSKSEKSAASNPRGCCARPMNWACPTRWTACSFCARTPPSASPSPNISAAPRGDVVYDLEITPNRPDWNSVIGIAREISALTGQAVAPAGNQHSPGAIWRASRRKNLSRCASSEPELCPRYTARLMRGVKIGPSPDWLRSALEKAGLRSINNVVDVTNYVMLETGHPLHAFDFRLLGAAPAQSADGGRPPRARRRKICHARRQGTTADRSNAADRRRNQRPLPWPASWAARTARSIPARPMC